MANVFEIPFNCYPLTLSNSCIIRLKLLIWRTTLKCAHVHVVSDNWQGTALKWIFYRKDNTFYISQTDTPAASEKKNMLVLFFLLLLLCIRRVKLVFKQSVPNGGVEKRIIQAIEKYINKRGSGKRKRKKLHGTYKMRRRDKTTLQWKGGTTTIYR